jgi:glycosyltransferase involved in cell wall biosynthesis
MRVLFLLSQDLESPSGLGRYWPLSKELVQLGHSVTIAALHSNYRSLATRRFIREGVQVRYVAQMHVRKEGNRKSYFSPLSLIWITAQATLALSRAALSIPADIVQICKPHPMNGIAGILAKMLHKRTLFLDCDDIEAAVNRFDGDWQKRGVAFFENYLPRHVDFVTTHTSVNRDRLLALGIPENRLFYLSNGVDRARFALHDPQRIKALRDELELVGKKVVAYIGSLSLAGHPVDLLLKAFVIIHQTQPESILLLVGGGDDYEKLQTQAREMGIGQVTIFCGHVSPEDVGLYYFLSDLSVDPVYDNDAARGRSPLKLFESWACGTPFVSADVGDRHFLIGDPPAGLLAMPGDPLSLAQVVLKILEDQGLAKTLRQRGLERVHTYFWDRLAVGLDELYRRSTITG